MIRLKILKIKSLLTKMGCILGVAAIIYFAIRVQVLNNTETTYPFSSYYHPRHKSILKDIKSIKNDSVKTALLDTKYILFWKPLKHDPLYYLNENGQKGFIKHKCKVNICYATDNRKLFGDDLTKFNAIVFNGQTFKQNGSWLDLPHVRSEHQKYILFETQSADNYPLCSDKFDNFFNWTMTYKLDSDITCPNIIVKNKSEHVIGPRMKVKWHDEDKFNVISLEGYDDNYEDIERKIPQIKTKNKAVAWFPTDCTKRNQGKIFAYKLKEALMTYKMDVDVYGECGPLICMKGNRECDYIERDYYFLLVVETSQAIDYVTDKILTALHSNVVPIVYGGANYSRFLPPESFVDGTSLPEEEIAKIVIAAMESPHYYKRFFKWKELFTFHKVDPVDNVCALCAAINDEAMMMDRKVYKNLRKWWNPDFKEKCKDKMYLYNVNE